MNALEQFDPIIEQVQQIKAKGDFLPDCSNDKGYEASKRFVLDITTKARKALEARHKEVKAPFAKAVKDIDAKKNELMSLLKEIEEPHRLAYKKVDEEEKLKKQRFEEMLQKKIEELVSFRYSLEGLTVEELQDRLMSCGEIDTCEGFYHRELDATKARAESLSAIEEAIQRREAYDLEQEQNKKDREELARLRQQVATSEPVARPTTETAPPVEDLETAQIEEAISMILVDVAGITVDQSSKIVEAIMKNQIPFIQLSK